MVKARNIYIVLMTGLCLTFGFHSMKVQANDFKVGVVDTQQILTKSKLFTLLKNAEQEVASAEKKLYDARNIKIKELQEAEKKVSPDEFLKLRQKYEREIVEQVKSEEKKLQQRKTQIEKMKTDLEKNVQTAVEDIAKKRNYVMVVNKQLVLFGGDDITQDVVNKVAKQMQ